MSTESIESRSDMVGPADSFAKAMGRSAMLADPCEATQRMEGMVYARDILNQLKAAKTRGEITEQDILWGFYRAMGISLEGAV